MHGAEGTLAAAGHKRGGARRAVVELLDSQRCALTAVEIEDALRGGEARRRVSRASVYRILEELERLRLALAAHDPQRTLARGYALVEDAAGEPVTSAVAARAAGRLRLRFADDAVSASVEGE